MKSPLRITAGLVSAIALLGGAVTGLAAADNWSLFSGTASQSPQPAPTPATPASGAPTAVASLDGRYRDGGYVGAAVDAYYGPMQVKANVSGGRIVSIDVLQYPADRRTSKRINSEALPALESEAISAQSAQVDIVSGATLTSEAYARSLDSALSRAGR